MRPQLSQKQLSMVVTGSVLESALPIRRRIGRRLTALLFYNTQGRKYDLAAGTTFVSGKLYVGPEWENNDRRSDVWATAVDSGGAVAAYPIIGFINGEGFRVWTSAGWKTIGYPAGFSYGKWYDLAMQLESESVKYYIDGTLVDTAPFAGAVGYSDVILQAYNFGANYDAYWDDLYVGAEPPTVSTPASSWWSVAALALVGAAFVVTKRRRLAI